MMRLSDIVGRAASPTLMISVALLLFLSVFLAIFFYAYVLLGRDTVKRYAAMPLEENTLIEVATVPSVEVTTPTQRQVEEDQ